MSRVVTVNLVNRADDCRVGGSSAKECAAAVALKGYPNAFDRCRYAPRWRFVLDDPRFAVWVCRHHANKGERAGELDVWETEVRDV